MTDVAAAGATADILTGDPRRTGGGEPPEGVCANCETPLEGQYCHACGQRAHLHHRLTDLGHEALESIAHFDGRLWRTLPLLAFRPGRLSREWMAGRRTRYVQPLHLFLFAVFLLFLFPNFTGRHVFDVGGEGAAGVFTTTEDGRRVPLTAAQKAELTADMADEPAVVRGAIGMADRLSKNPEYYGYKIEGLAYKLSFVTVPISIGILALLFAWRRRFSLYDHAVVSLYGLGFITLLMAVGSLLPSFLGELAAFVIMLIAPVHALVHLRGAYEIGWFSAALRTVALSVLTLVGFGLFLLGVVFLGLAG